MEATSPDYSHGILSVNPLQTKGQEEEKGGLLTLNSAKLDFHHSHLLLSFCHIQACGRHTQTYDIVALS
jgi:hypothetical protein